MGFLIGALMVIGAALLSGSVYFFQNQHIPSYSMQASSYASVEIDNEPQAPVIPLEQQKPETQKEESKNTADVPVTAEVLLLIKLSFI